MALTCPVDFDMATLRHEIQTMYSRVATAPGGEFHFHRGPEYAVTRLGYDADELAALPLGVTSSFAGVGNPHAIGRTREHGRRARRRLWRRDGSAPGRTTSSSGGRAIGVDMTEMMRTRAAAGAAECGLTNVDVLDGDATRLPLSDRSVDVVISNGVLNLVPDKHQASGRSLAS